MAARGRPKSAKPAPKPLSEDEIEERRLAEEDDEDEDEDDDDVDSDDGDEDDTPTPPKRNLTPQLPPTDDIFDFCEMEYVRKGVPVSFIVSKNGTLIGELQFPLSWHALQQEWGGGLYTVRAKNINTKKFLKVQTMTVAEPPNRNSNKKNDEAPVEKPVERYMPQEPQQPPVNFLELLSFMQKTQSDSSDKVREAQREARDSQTTLMAAMMQMMSQTAKPQTSSDDKIMALMMQMQQNTNQMFEKVMMMTRESISEVSKSSEKIFEKLSQRIDTLADTKKPSGLEYSPQQVMELMMQGQQRGFEMWSQMERLADVKASQRLEILEATKSEAVEESRPKSLTEKLVDSMLPAVASVISAQVAAQQRSPQPALPAAPRPKPVPAKPQAPAPRQAPARPRPAAPQPKPRPKPSPEAPRVPEVIEVEAAPKADPFGFPSASTTAPVENPIIEASAESFDEEKFNAYMNHAATSLMNSYQAKKPIPDTTLELVSSLQAQGIEVPDFLSACPRAKVNETLQSFGADETIMNFVGEVYAHLEARTAMGLGG